MRILLLNDTTNNFHLGCASVTNTIRRFLFGIDGVELRSIFNRELRCDNIWQLLPTAEAWFMENIRWCDMLIVNGEGSLHHSRSPELVRALQIAKEEGVPFCVVNTILEDYPSLLPILAYAEVVTLRDGASLQTAQLAGLPAERCADAALFASFSDLSIGISGKEIGVTDWHPMAPAEAGRTAIAHLTAGARFYPFVRPNANWAWPEVVHDLGRFSNVVCGRYHGALFSLLAARSLTLLPSNSWKMQQLLVDLSIPIEPESYSMAKPMEVSESSARLAREQLLEMRATPELHPLFRVGLGQRKHRIGRIGTDARPVSFMPGLPEIEAPPTVLARRIADWLVHLNAPVSRRETLSCDDVLTKAGTGVLKQSAEFLILEGEATPAVWVLGKLLELGGAASAFPLALELRNRIPSSAAANFVFALMANASEDVLSAYAFSTIADGQKPLSGKWARLAARIAGKAGDFPTKARFLQAYGATVELNGELWRELAVAASFAEQTDLALNAARSALKTNPPLAGWPRIQVANTQAANGAFVEGFRELSRLLPASDEAYAQLAEAVVSTGVDTAVYIPPMVGVGAAVTAAMPLLLGMFGVDDPTYLIVEERLHPAFSRVLGDRVMLLPNTAGVDRSRLGRVVNGYDLLGLLELSYGARSVPPFLTADPVRAAELRADYRQRFGSARLVGLAWHTSNPRSGGWRNLPVAQLRSFLAEHPEWVFVSLQPVLEKAIADREVLMRPNLFVDSRIDPHQSIEDQLAQISVLDCVVSIDCSSGIFAGALGVPSIVIVNGEPTWQWPQRKSFFRSGHVVRDINEVAQHFPFC